MAHPDPVVPVWSLIIALVVGLVVGGGLGWLLRRPAQRAAGDGAAPPESLEPAAAPPQPAPSAPPQPVIPTTPPSGKPVAEEEPATVAGVSSAVLIDLPPSKPRPIAGLPTPPAPKTVAEPSGPEPETAVAPPAPPSEPETEPRPEPETQPEMPPPPPPEETVVTPEAAAEAPTTDAETTPATHAPEDAEAPLQGPPAPRRRRVGGEQGVLDLGLTSTKEGGGDGERLGARMDDVLSELERRYKGRRVGEGDAGDEGGSRPRRPRP